MTLLKGIGWVHPLIVFSIQSLVFFNFFGKFLLPFKWFAIFLEFGLLSLKSSLCSLIFYSCIIQFGSFFERIFFSFKVLFFHRLGLWMCWFSFLWATEVPDWVCSWICLADFRVPTSIIGCLLYSSHGFFEATLFAVDSIFDSVSLRLFNIAFEVLIIECFTIITINYSFWPPWNSTNIWLDFWRLLNLWNRVRLWF